MKFKTATKEQRKKHLKFLKWFCIIPLISFILWLLLIFFQLDITLKIISLMFFWLGFLGINIFLTWFLIENLIVMWKTKHYFYFCFSLVFGIVALAFYSNYYYPYLKGDISFEEI